MARVDYEEQAGRYDKGRQLPDEAIAVWMATARRHFGTQPGQGGRILDLGCGTGAWSGPLANANDCQVVGVEPSRAMLEHARSKAHASVRLACGEAEHIPLRDDTCDAAWLSAVIHHFNDLGQAARELRRVLRPGAPVLIRGAFPGRGPIGSLDRFFPATARALDTFPSVEATYAAFEAAGFADLSVEKVEQITAHHHHDTIERVRQRADTALQSLTDEEFAEGLAKLEHAAEHEHGPVIDALDLVVLR